MESYPGKVISGGQTGVDRAALEVAAEFNYETGGWCPPGRLSESGTIPNKFSLRETPAERSAKAPHIPRSLRTEWNVRDSDATLILTINNKPVGPGTMWSREACRIYNKPYLLIDLLIKENIEEIKQWLKDHKIKILNIAGPSEMEQPGIGEIAGGFLLRLFSGNE